MHPRLLDVAQLVAHLVRDQEVAGSSPVIQTLDYEALAKKQAPLSFYEVAVLSQFQCYITLLFYRFTINPTSLSANIV